MCLIDYFYFYYHFNFCKPHNVEFRLFKAMLNSVFDFPVCIKFLNNPLKNQVFCPLQILFFRFVGDTNLFEEVLWLKLFYKYGN